MNMLDLILDIEKRPALYIGKNYISCLKSFLDGCIFSNPNMLNSHILVDFEMFVKEKYNITSSQSWVDVIIFYSIDENEALNNFFSLFHEFINLKIIEK